MARRAPFSSASSAPAASRYRNRVIDFRYVRASDLVRAERNWRAHPAEQRAALDAFLASVGIVGAVVTRLLPDGRLELVDGEARADADETQLWPCIVTDLDDDEAAEALAGFDAITQLALPKAQVARDLAQLVARRNAGIAGLLQTVSAQNAAADLIERLRGDRQRLLQLTRPSTTEGDEPEAGDRADAALYGERRSSPAIEDYEQDDDQELDDLEADALDFGDDAQPHEPAEDAAGPVLYSPDQVLDVALAHFRATGFPYRTPAPHVAMQQINKLARMPLDDLPRALMASDLADAYHPHRFHATVPGHLSPAQAFEDDALLRHALELRLKYIGWLPDGYPTTLNIVHHTQAASNFRPGFAAYLYRRFGPIEVASSITLDTSTGYGGRIVGWLASGLAQRDAETGAPLGRYIGIDPNTLTHAGNLKLAADLLASDQIELINLPAEDVDPVAFGLTARCDFAFTSPPYFAREHYSDEETQSWRRYPTGEAWRAGFLRPMLRLQFAALRPGAKSVINIDDVEIAGVTYPLASAWIVADAEDAGFRLIERLDFALHTRLGAGHRADRPNREPVFVFEKPISSASATFTLTAPARAASSATHSDVTISDKASDKPAPTQPMTLERWMAQLYARTVDESTLTGDLGIWPRELGAYLTRLCRAYTPLDAAPARITLRSGLLLPLPGIAEERAELEFPSTPTLALLFSGGKDSIAAGLIAQAQGFAVHALYVAKANYSYPHEAAAAEQIAELLGWRFTRVTPQRLPRTRGESVVKNQYLLSVAAEALDSIPQRIACGNYRIEDCHTTSWFSDMEPAFAAFDEAFSASYALGGRTFPTRLTLLDDELSALRVWEERAPAAVKRLTASCILPERNKPQHRRRCLEQGVPLVSDYDCGVCEKCKSRAVLLADRIGTELVYPPRYLANARKSLAKAYTALLWCHAHPSLEVVAAAGEDLPPSGSWVVERMYNGTLGVAPRFNTLPAVEPIVVNE